MSEKYDVYLRSHRKAVAQCYELLTGGCHLPIYDDDGNPVGHDASKYSEEEYQAYDEYFFPSDGSKVGEDPARSEAFDRAWLHHQNCNPHHWQHWCLINDDDGKTVPLEMPVDYVYEMVADWGSFAYRMRKGQNLLDWYDANRDKMMLHGNTRRLVEVMVCMLAAMIDESFEEVEA